MADIWPVNMRAEDKQPVIELARRRQVLGLPHTYAETIRAAVALAATASDDDLKRGEL